MILSKAHGDDLCNSHEGCLCLLNCAVHKPILGRESLSGLVLLKIIEQKSKFFGVYLELKLGSLEVLV